MKPTERMIDQELMRTFALRDAQEMIEAEAEMREHGGPDEIYLDEAIKRLMIGSHAGRLKL